LHINFIHLEQGSLPSGDSSQRYVPVRYRWTNADFPLPWPPRTP